MTILCIGSVNIDHVYGVERLPKPGETISDNSYQVHLGGKGANMALAAAHAGADVCHAGAIGIDGTWCRDRLAAAGIDVSAVAQAEVATGHAIILVDRSAENVIVIHAGANRALKLEDLRKAISRRSAGDWVLLQNETNLVSEAAKEARDNGLKVAYAAAPFDAEAVGEVMPYVDLLAVNEVEAAQLGNAWGVSPDALPLPSVLVTHGAAGASLVANGEVHRVPAFRVEAVDTTGAGDTFTGYFLAGLDRGQSAPKALVRAAAAAALQVTRPGAADAIPKGDEVDTFMEQGCES